MGENAVDIEQIAQVCHESVRAYRVSLGEHPPPAWAEAPDWQKRSSYAAVKFRLDNPDADDAAQHAAWMRERLDAGWTYGPVRDAEARTHPMLRPYETLPEHERRKDALVRAVISALSGPA